VGYERKDLQIGENMYSILPIPVQPQGIRIALRTTSLLGGLIGVLGAVASGIQDAAQQFSSALAEVDPDKAHALLMDAVIASKLHCNNEAIHTVETFTIHFNNHQDEVFQVMSWCLWEGVKGFIPLTLRSMLTNVANSGVSAFQQSGQQNTGLGNLSGMGSVPGQK